MSLHNKLKPLYISFFAIASLILFAFTTTLASDIMSKWFGIPIGIIITILAIPIHFLGDRCKLFYILCLIMNVTGMGFIASAYYIQKSVTADFSSFLLASLCPLAILLISTIIMAIASNNDNTKLITWIVTCVLDVAVLITSIVFWILRGGEYYAFSTFACIVVGFFLAAILYIVNDDDNSALTGASMCSFGALFGVFVVVLCALGCDDCDCSGCDGCDCGDCGGKSKKSKKIK